MNHLLTNYTHELTFCLKMPPHEGENFTEQLYFRPHAKLNTLPIQSGGLIAALCERFDSSGAQHVALGARGLVQYFVDCGIIDLPERRNCRPTPFELGIPHSTAGRLGRKAGRGV